jgi:hypothetical protein
VKKKNVGRQRGGKGKRRPLRRETLVQQAHEILLKWTKLSPETHPINLARLAKELVVSRQALYDNGMDKEIDRYRSLQRKNFSPDQSTPNRKSADQQIADLKEQVAGMQRQLDGWIERWAAVEYNARMLGVDPDEIFAPLPDPQRAGVVRRTRLK